MMTESGPDARARVGLFLAAHTESGKSDEIAICDYHDGTGGYAVAVLWAHDLRDALTEVGGITEPDGQAAEPA